MRLFGLKVGFAILLVALACQPARATTYHVSPHGSNTPPYDTYAKAANHPAEAALAASGRGDTILIHAGTYETDTTIHIPAYVVLTGVGRDSATLVWTYPRGLPEIQILIEFDHSYLDGIGGGEVSGLRFYFPRGADSKKNVVGVLARVEDTILVSHCQFTQLWLSIGGSGVCEVYDCRFEFGSGRGLSLGAGECRAHHNEFWGGGNGNGAGITCHGAGFVTIEHNTFKPDERQKYYTGVDIFHSTNITIRNNLFIGAAEPVDWSYASGLLENNTMIGASRPWTGLPVLLRDYESVIVRNNLFYDFLAPPRLGSECEGCSSGPITLVHNTYWPTPESLYTYYFWTTPEEIRLVDSGNVVSWPMFQYDPESGDTDSSFVLQYASGLIDTGDPVVTDVDGSRSDIGWSGGPGGWSYDYRDQAPSPPDSLRAIGHDTTVAIDWSQHGEADLAGYRLYAGPDWRFWQPGLQPLAELGAQDTSFTHVFSTAENGYAYVVTAFDASGQEGRPSAEAEYYLVLPPRPPSLSIPSYKVVWEGNNLTVPISATDPNGDAVTLSGEDLPEHAVLVDHGDNTGSFVFDPDYTQSGDYTVRFVASDGALADTATFDFRVLETGNHPPTWMAVGEQTVNEGSTLQLPLTAVDVDGDSLGLELISHPRNLQFVAQGDNTGMLIFSPDYSQAGTYAIYLVANDGEFADTTLINIKVTDRSDLLPKSPTIIRTYPNPFNANLLIEYSIPETAVGQPVTLEVYNVLGQRVASLDAGLSSPGLHQIEWSPNTRNGRPLSSGVYAVRLRVNGRAVGNPVKAVLLK